MGRMKKGMRTRRISRDELDAPKKRVISALHSFLNRPAENLDFTWPTQTAPRHERGLPWSLDTTSAPE